MSIVRTIATLATATLCLWAEGAAQQPPQASFTYTGRYDTPSALRPVAKTFDASSSRNIWVSGNALDSKYRFEWDFGDGTGTTTTTNTSIGHQYTSPNLGSTPEGHYNVRLTLQEQDAYGNWNNVHMFTKDVYYQRVRAHFHCFVENRTQLPVPVRFSADRSCDREKQGSLQFDWNFGDGSTGTGTYVTHQYSSTGYFDVALTVTTADGATEAVTRTIHVSFTTARPSEEARVKDLKYVVLNRYGTLLQYADDSWPRDSKGNKVGRQTLKRKIALGFKLWQSILPDMNVREVTSRSSANLEIHIGTRGNLISGGDIYIRSITDIDPSGNPVYDPLDAIGGENCEFFSHADLFDMNSNGNYSAYTYGSDFAYFTMHEYGHALGDWDVSSFFSHSEWRQHDHIPYDVAHVDYPHYGQWKYDNLTYVAEIMVPLPHSIMYQGIGVSTVNMRCVSELDAMGLWVEGYDVQYPAIQGLIKLEQRSGDIYYSRNWEEAQQMMIWPVNGTQGNEYDDQYFLREVYPRPATDLDYQFCPVDIPDQQRCWRIVTATEVTVGKYTKLMNRNSSGEDAWNKPVNNVTYYDAVVFCNRLSEERGLEKVYSYGEDPSVDNNGYTIVGLPGLSADTSKNGFRLPFADEWQSLYRGGTTGDYYWGQESAADNAWYLDNAGWDPQPVKGKEPNDHKLYDMAGNVSEWVEPAGTVGRADVYGGSCGDSEDNLKYNSKRSHYCWARDETIGFRVVRKAADITPVINLLLLD